MADLDTHKLKQLMMAMIDVIEQSENKNDHQNKDSPPIIEDAIIKDKQIKTGNKRPNLFESMIEKDMHKSDIAIDKKLCSQPPTVRARPVSMIDAQCCICGKRETVSKRLLIDGGRYKCNNCCSKGSS